MLLENAFCGPSISCFWRLESGGGGLHWTSRCYPKLCRIISTKLENSVAMMRLECPGMKDAAGVQWETIDEDMQQDSGASSEQQHVGAWLHCGSWRVQSG